MTRLTAIMRNPLLWVVAMFLFAAGTLVQAVLR